MRSVFFSVYLFVVLLGLMSYVVCFFITKKRTSYSMSSFLFEGNNEFLGIASTVGTVFSVAVMFTAVPALNLIYGYITYLISLIAMGIGLSLFRVKLNRVFVNSEDGKEELSLTSIRRYNRLIASEPGSQCFYVFILIYLLMIAITETGAVWNLTHYLLQDSPWAAAMVYMVVFLSIAYVYVGGFLGVLATDAIQILLIIFIFAVLLFFNPAELKWSAPISVNDFSVKTPTQTIVFAVSWTILLVACFSSVPELWNRIVTLPHISSARKSIPFSYAGIGIVLLMPSLLLFLSGVRPSEIAQHTVAYDFWARIFLLNNSALTFLFLILVSTALFTTIDTYIITFSQVTFQIENICWLTIWDSTKKDKHRYSATIFILISFFIGKQLPSNVNVAMGIFAASLAIPIFFRIYFESLIRLYISEFRVPVYIYCLPLLLSYHIIVYSQSAIPNSQLGLAWIPIIVFLIYGVAISCYILFFIIRVFRRR